MQNFSKTYQTLFPAVRNSSNYPEESKLMDVDIDNEIKIPQTTNETKDESKEFHDTFTREISDIRNQQLRQMLQPQSSSQENLQQGNIKNELAFPQLSLVEPEKIVKNLESAAQKINSLEEQVKDQNDKLNAWQGREKNHEKLKNDHKQLITEFKTLKSEYASLKTKQEKHDQQLAEQTKRATKCADNFAQLQRIMVGRMVEFDDRGKEVVSLKAIIDSKEQQAKVALQKSGECELSLRQELQQVHAEKEFLLQELQAQNNQLVDVRQQLEQAHKLIRDSVLMNLPPQQVALLSLPLAPVNFQVPLPQPPVQSQRVTGNFQQPHST